MTTILLTSSSNVILIVQLNWALNQYGILLLHMLTVHVAAAHCASVIILNG